MSRLTSLSLQYHLSNLQPPNLSPLSLSSSMAEAIDFSQTHRIVLLIDLNPLVHLQNPSPYLTSILTTSQLLLTFPSLSTSLFAFKLFFSSLSPLRSSSSLHRLLPNNSFSPSLSFNRPSGTLDSLSRTLNSLSESPISAEFESSTSRASHLAGSLLQIVHDYSWECEIRSVTPNNFPFVKSNLIILFSSIRRSLNYLSEFMDVDINDESLTNVDSLSKNLHDVFGVVKDAYVSRDIHFSWVDVNYEFECNEEKSEIDESMSQLGFFKNGIRNLGWGFYSTNSIVLGSAVIPFGLIYPSIGISFKFLDSNDNSSPAQLSLEILDVSGKPLECKCCELELTSTKMLPRLRSDDIVHTLEYFNSESEGFKQKDKFWNHFGDGIIKLDVKTVCSYDESEKLKGCTSDHFLLRGFSGIPGKSTEADRIHDILFGEQGKFTLRKTLPIWQILLSFLYRRGYWALVSLSNGKGDSCMALIKPFTADLAFLSIIDNEHAAERGFGGSSSSKIEIGTTSSKKIVPLGDGKRKKNEKNLYRDLTWSSFYKAAYERSNLPLEEVYFAKMFDKSKKLKFLKCWMKQINNSSFDSLTMSNGSKLHQSITKSVDEERLTGARNDSEKPIHSDFLTGPSKTEEDVSPSSLPETSAAFFSDIPKKIQQGIESEGVDLQILAERLVNLSIHWLYQKFETNTSTGDPNLCIKSDENHGQIVAGELINILLREPKKLKEKSKISEPSCPSDPRSTGPNTVNIVREYELQILLRMEILHSKVADSIEGPIEKKFVKHICSFLEIIQYLLEGGFHGNDSLYDYVERTIKSRYSNTLGDVVERIYARLDLLPFGDEKEAPILLFNSEDSNHSWREKKDADETGETNKLYPSNSAENDPSQPTENNDDSPQGIKKEEHARKVSEAQKRREKARRHVSFTSWIPDLQRVWAPKQPKATAAAKSESLQKQSKKRERRRRRTSYDIVCETPFTGKKLSCPRGSSVGEEEQYDHGSNSSISVSKALFQDDL